MFVRDGSFYYDYAGGTYYCFKLCWFYDCPDTKEYEELVFIKYGEDTFIWHIFYDKRDINGVKYACGYAGPLKKVTKKLKEYCQQQRKSQDEYREKFR